MSDRAQDLGLTNASARWFLGLFYATLTEVSKGESEPLTLPDDFGLTGLGYFHLCCGILAIPVVPDLSLSPSFFATRSHRLDEDQDRILVDFASQYFSKTSLRLQHITLLLFARLGHAVDVLCVCSNIPSDLKVGFNPSVHDFLDHMASGHFCPFSIAEIRDHVYAVYGRSKTVSPIKPRSTWAAYGFLPEHIRTHLDLPSFHSHPAFAILDDYARRANVR